MHTCEATHEASGNGPVAGAGSGEGERDGERCDLLTAYRLAEAPRASRRTKACSGERDLRCGRSRTGELERVRLPRGERERDRDLERRRDELGELRLRGDRVRGVAAMRVDSFWTGVATAEAVASSVRSLGASAAGQEESEPVLENTSRYLVNFGERERGDHEREGNCDSLQQALNYHLMMYHTFQNSSSTFHASSQYSA